MRAFVIHAACQQVHRRTADKTRYKQAGGLFVDFNWCANLFGNTAVHHHYSLGERHRFNLIVSNVE